MAGNFHQPKSASSGIRTSVIEVRDFKKLARLVPAWENLAAAALEPNVFYEHWMLLPALETFGAKQDIRVILVLLHDAHKPLAPPTLAGLFPLEFNHRFGKLNILSLWRHVHCFLCTPLIRRDVARECMGALFNWVRSAGVNSPLIQFKWISGDGPFHNILSELSSELGLVSGTTETFTRGLWRDTSVRDGGGLTAARNQAGGQHRTLRRREKRLRERGRVEHVALEPGENVGRWIDDFLRLEAGGWKGRSGSALACSEGGRRYFRQIATAAHDVGRLLMLGINFDGRPIARRCAFVAGEGSFAFKTAYDEEFAYFSPGTMLEIDNLRQFHALSGVQWMDSCAAADNGLVNRLSNDRRTIQSLSTGSGALGELVAAGLPALHWTSRRLRNGLLRMNAADFTPRQRIPRLGDD